MPKLFRHVFAFATSPTESWSLDQLFALSATNFITRKKKKNVEYYISKSKHIRVSPRIARGTHSTLLIECCQIFIKQHSRFFI